MSFIVGILFMAATYLLLSKSLLRVIIGTAVLSHGVHLLLLTMGGLKKGAPPIFRSDPGHRTVRDVSRQEQGTRAENKGSNF